MEQYLTPKLLAGIACGWCTYPTDGKEQGEMFHMEPDKTPFGRIMEVRNWRPHRSLGDSYDLMIRLKISVEYKEQADGMGTMLRATKVVGERKWECVFIADTHMEIVERTMEAVFDIAVAIGKTMPVPACMAMLLPMPEVNNETK